MLGPLGREGRRLTHDIVQEGCVDYYRPVLTDIGEETEALFDRREAERGGRARREAPQEARALTERRREIEEQAEEHATAVARDLREFEEVSVGMGQAPRGRDARGPYYRLVPAGVQRKPRDASRVE